MLAPAFRGSMRVALLLFLGALALPLGLSAPTDPQCLGGTGIHVVGTVPVPAPIGLPQLTSTYYVDDRGVAANGVWVYEETNSRAWLQRGGSGQWSADRCVDDPKVVPDALVL